jgi:putative tricarboxylic transport membrane protein
MKRADQITSIVFILGSIFLLYKAGEIEELKVQLTSSRMFPQLIFITTIVLAIALFIRSFIIKDSANQGAKAWATLVSPKRLTILAMFTVYLLIIPVIGFLCATAVFMVAAITVLSPQKKKDLPIGLAITGGLVGMIYLVFAYWLQVFLP